MSLVIIGGCLALHEMFGVLPTPGWSHLFFWHHMNFEMVPKSFNKKAVIVVPLITMVVTQVLVVPISST
jgi:hypothetical protein